MKADRTTEKFSIDSLTGASADRSIKCPDGFGHELSDMIDSLDAAERIIISGESKDRNTWHWLVGVAACIAIIAGIGFSTWTSRTPEDTFTDPAQAYAEAENALSAISERMGRGTALAAKAEKTMERQTAILKELY